MYIVDSKLTDEQLEPIVAKYSQLITDQGGSVRAAGRWDKRRLAYDIMGHGEAIFVLMVFEAEPAAVKELDRVMRISDDVIRHLITRVEPEHVDISRIGQQPIEEAIAETVEAPQAEAESAEEPVTAEEAVEIAEAEPTAEETASAETQEAEPAAEEIATAETQEAEPAVEETAAAESPESKTAEDSATAEQVEAVEETGSEDKKEEP